jgi:uncharacterized protein
MINNEALKLAVQFTLKEEYFDHQSDLHGIGHTYRVMTHSLILGNILKLERETKLALCCAFIHDMARKHDGKCFQHGAWASEHKFPRFFPFFKSLGVAERDSDEIRTAVTWHSLSTEINAENPFRKTVALLKDADALDRIRLGDLNRERLRFPETAGLVDCAEKLYYQTVTKKQIVFSDYLSHAINLLR